MATVREVRKPLLLRVCLSSVLLNPQLTYKCMHTEL